MPKKIVEDSSSVKEKLKSIHISPTTHGDLQELKKRMALSSISEVIECLIRLHDASETFPRSYVDYVDALRRG